MYQTPKRLCLPAAFKELISSGDIYQTATQKEQLLSRPVPPAHEIKSVFDIFIHRGHDHLTVEYISVFIDRFPIKAFSRHQMHSAPIVPSSWNLVRSYFRSFMALLVLQNYLSLQLMGIPGKHLVRENPKLARQTQPVTTAMRMTRECFWPGGIQSVQLGQANRTCRLH